MTTVTVYDPAMCCSTGICGVEVDQNLVNFAADLDWLKTQGVTVMRINLSQEPAAFAANDTVKSVLQNDGVDGLPVILFKDELHSKGRYPARAELADMAGVICSAGAPIAPEAKAETTGSGCCGSDQKSASSGCC